MKVLLNKNIYCEIDKCDLNKISTYKWYCARNGNTCYAQSWVKKDGVKRTITMHRLIMGFPDMPIDHIDRNGLNNKKSNLRVCSHSENLKNTIGRSRSGNGFKGVYKQSRGKRYMALIFPNQKYIHLGLYDTAEDAAKAYDQKAIELYGPKCYTNFPQK